MSKVQLKIKKLTVTSILPFRATEGSSGMDLYADLVGRGGEMRLDAKGGINVKITIQPGDVVSIPTGLALDIPEGSEGQIRSRSGLAFKRHISVANAPGTIDSDYRGEVKVLLYNMGKVPQQIVHGERIAQLVIAKVEMIPIKEVAELSDTTRGEGGFGSTGTR